MIIQLVKHNLRLGRYAKAIKISQEKLTSNENQEAMTIVKFLIVFAKKNKLIRALYKKQDYISQMLFLSEYLYRLFKKKESITLMKAIVLTTSFTQIHTCTFMTPMLGYHFLKSL